MTEQTVAGQESLNTSVIVGTVAGITQGSNPYGVMILSTMMNDVN